MSPYPRGRILHSIEDFKDQIVRISGIEEVRYSVEELLERGVEPHKILNALNEAMEEVGKRYEEGEYFLSELIMVGVLASEISELVDSRLNGIEGDSRGKVIIGTVKGDIHDIGKNILIMMLNSAGFRVIDLGVDVSPERFAESIEKEDADILCVSALLTSTMENIRSVIDMLRERGLRDEVKVIVGGRPLTASYARELGADGYAKDAVEGVKKIIALLSSGG